LASEIDLLFITGNGGIALGGPSDSQSGRIPKFQ
jgi:hypothetical protein